MCNCPSMSFEKPPCILIVGLLYFGSTVCRSWSLTKNAQFLHIPLSPKKRKSELAFKPLYITWLYDQLHLYLDTDEEQTEEESRVARRWHESQGWTRCQAAWRASIHLEVGAPRLLVFHIANPIKHMLSLLICNGPVCFISLVQKTRPILYNVVNIISSNMI